MSTSPALAQQAERGDSIQDLPRRGYEPRTIRVDGIIIAPQLVAEGHYDSNVYAAPQNPSADFVYNITPQVTLDARHGNLVLAADAIANFRGHATNTREDSLTYGVGGTADYTLAEVNHLTGTLRYARGVESRADPEADRSKQLRPSRLDLFSAKGIYRYRRNRVGLDLTGAIDKVGYLPIRDRDRDGTNYRLAGRAALELDSRFNMFVEAFGNLRDQRLPRDRSGIDRDQTTVGLLGGATVDIAERWRGEGGIGIYRANPADPSLRSFNLFGANGRIVWSPTARTTVTTSFFRGDVATVRTGASGRIDTNVGVRVDQEARHNLILHARAGFLQTAYRGNPTEQQNTVSVAAGAEYLLSGQFSLTADAAFNHRTSRVALNEFDRASAGVGIRIRY